MDWLTATYFTLTNAWRDVVVDKDLTEVDGNKILTMLESFSDILTDFPWETSETTHVIILSNNTKIKV